jgi:hypothetical protein
MDELTLVPAPAISRPDGGHDPRQHIFLEKKKQKTLRFDCSSRNRTGQNQKFFGAYFQNRTSFDFLFYSCLRQRL